MREEACAERRALSRLRIRSAAALAFGDFNPPLVVREREGEAGVAAMVGYDEVFVK